MTPQALQEVWLDQQNHVVVSTHDADFYAAWGRGEIKRVLRPDATTSSISQVIDQFFEHHHDHALAHRIFNVLITVPDAQTVVYSVASGQDRDGHAPVAASFHRYCAGVLEPLCLTGTVWKDDAERNQRLLDGLVAQVLRPDDDDVLSLLRRPSQTLAGNDLTSDQIGFSLVTRAITQVTRWCIEVPTLLMPASTIAVLLRDDHTNRLGFFQQGATTLMDKSVVCLGGPADPTWVDGTPDLVVVGKDLGWRAIAKPWTVNIGRSITASCRIATEVTNPRACCVVTLQK